MKVPTGKSLFLIAVACAVLWIGYAARAVVTPLLAALLLAYVLDPVVRMLQRLRFSRVGASVTVVLVSWVGMVAAMGFATTQLVGEATSFYEDVVGEPMLPADANDAEVSAEFFGGGPIPADRETVVRRSTWDGAPVLYHDLDHDGFFEPGIARTASIKLSDLLARKAWTQSLAAHLRGGGDIGPNVAAAAGRWLAGLAEGGQAALGTFAGFLTLMVLFPIYLYYSLARLPWVYDVFVRHLPSEHRDTVVRLLGQVHVTLSAFFRGRLILLALRFVVILVLLMCFGVPFSGVLAAFGAIASLVPVIGGIVANALPALIYFAAGSTVGELLWLVGLLFVYDAAENYVLTPMLVGKEVGLHALTILVSTFVAGELLGLFGMLVAIPITAVLKILMLEFVAPEVRRRAGIPAAAGERAAAPTEPPVTGAAKASGDPAR